MCELKVTKDKVIEAAKNDPQSEATLRTMFPEAFETLKIKIEYGNVPSLFSKGTIVIDSNYGENGCWLIAKEGNSFMINTTHYEWEIDSPYLIPSRK